MTLLSSRRSADAHRFAYTADRVQHCCISSGEIPEDEAKVKSVLAECLQRRKAEVFERDSWTEAVLPRLDSEQTEPDRRARVAIST